MTSLYVRVVGHTPHRAAAGDRRTTRYGTTPSSYPRAPATMPSLPGGRLLLLCAAAGLLAGRAAAADTEIGPWVGQAMGYGGATEEQITEAVAALEGAGFRTAEELQRAAPTVRLPALLPALLIFPAAPTSKPPAPWHARVTPLPGAATAGWRAPGDRARPESSDRAAPGAARAASCRPEPTATAARGATWRRRKGARPARPRGPEGREEPPCEPG